ncbi:MAG TPA: YggT family protein [Candidatus Omnitrophota bacterium]|nr:YggT family protein [Candidatus Omnitrophota bacterium]HPS37459.1 YggT family protein [Candidatus Omnitrophota bacterium]
MFVFGIIFQGAALMVDSICKILYWLLFARIIVSWFPVDPFSAPVRFLQQVTDPILDPLKRLPLRFGMMDLSPLLAFFILYVTNRVLVTVLLKMAFQFSGG